MVVSYRRLGTTIYPETSEKTTILRCVKSGNSACLMYTKAKASIH